MPREVLVHEMFRHKPHVDEIPDFKGFLVYLQTSNKELHDRYMKQVKNAMIADILVFAFFVACISFAIHAFVVMVGNPYLTDAVLAELFLFGGFLVGVVISSMFGRRAHTNAVRIESEIVVEYNREWNRGNVQ